MREMVVDRNEPANAGVQRRRTAPNEGVPLAPLSPAQHILTDFAFPV